VDWSPAGDPRVDFPGNELGPRVARRTNNVTPSDLRAADQLELLLAVTEDEVVILATLAPVQHPAESGAEPALPSTVHVDGQRVEIEGRDEIVLRCGQASLIMRRNGRIVLLGTYVETRSKGINRIKGGSVQIN
jgi:hypothetical protein